MTAPSLANFLLARISEDDAAARRVQERSLQWRDQLAQEMEEAGTPMDLADWFGTSSGPGSVARVLAECKSKRLTVRAHARWHVCPNVGGLGYTDHHDGSHPDDPDDNLCPTLTLMAMPYADHPDFREEWRDGFASGKSRAERLGIADEVRRIRESAERGMRELPDGV